MIRFLSIFIIFALTACGQTSGSTGINISPANDTLQNYISVGNGINGTIEAMAVYDDKLYVAGKFNNSDDGQDYTVAYWDGKTWVYLRNAINGARTLHSDGTVMSLAVYNNELYVGGCFAKVGDQSVYNITKWNGKAWSNVGGGLKGYFAAATEFGNHKKVLRYTDGFVNYMAVYNNELYVSGCFDSTSDNIRLHNFAKWDKKKWTPVGKGANDNIRALLEYKNELYAGGEFDTLDGKRFKHIAKWNGSKWTSVGDGVDWGDVRCLSVYDNDLYVGGCFKRVGDSTILGIAKWDGNKWASVSKGMSISQYGSVGSLEVYNNELYAGGLFDSAGYVSARNIAIWNKREWRPLKASEVIASDTITLSSANVNGKLCYVGVSGGVNALVKYKNNFYIAGTFYTLQSHHGMNIVIWKKGITSHN